MGKDNIATRKDGDKTLTHIQLSMAKDALAAKDY